VVKPLPKAMPVSRLYVLRATKPLPKATPVSRLYACPQALCPVGGHTHTGWELATRRESTDTKMDIDQARMARGFHGLQVSLGLAMPDPSTPCGQATPETAIQLFLEWRAHRVRGLRPPYTPLDTPCRMGLL
jgi:hypothetical protein